MLQSARLVLHGFERGQSYRRACCSLQKVCNRECTPGTGRFLKGQIVRENAYFKKQKEFNDDANLRSNTVSAAGDNVVILDNNPIGDTAFKNFVGYQDSADYAKIVLTKNGTLTFKVTALANVTFEIWQKGTDKKGKNVLNSLQKKTSVTVKEYAVGASVTTNALTLDAGEYYISVTAKSTKANEKGSAFYNVTAMFSPSESVTDALAMPETDALAMTDSLSFASLDTDVLAGASAFDKLASLDDASSWQAVAKLA